jgi:hypothetical protein
MAHQGSKANQSQTKLCEHSGRSHESGTATGFAAMTVHAPPLTIPGDIGIVAQLFQTCVELTKMSSSALKEIDHASPRHQRAFTRFGQSFTLWGQGHDISSGGLDATIQKSKRLQHVTIRALRSILQRLVFGMLEFEPGKQ